MRRIILYSVFALMFFLLGSSYASVGYEGKLAEMNTRLQITELFYTQRKVHPEPTIIVGRDDIKSVCNNRKSIETILSEVYKSHVNICSAVRMTGKCNWVGLSTAQIKSSMLSVQSLDCSRVN